MVTVQNILLNILLIVRKYWPRIDSETRINIQQFCYWRHIQFGHDFNGCNWRENLRQRRVQLLQMYKCLYPKRRMYLRSKGLCLLNFQRIACTRHCTSLTSAASWLPNWNALKIRPKQVTIVQPIIIIL
jgi:hypothetical protein